MPGIRVLRAVYGSKRPICAARTAEDLPGRDANLFVYHRTNEAAALSILTSGFRDATGNYLTDEHTGCWLSDRALDANGFPPGIIPVTTLCNQCRGQSQTWTRHPKKIPTKNRVKGGRIESRRDGIRQRLQPSAQPRWLERCREQSRSIHFPGGCFGGCS